MSESSVRRKKKRSQHGVIWRSEVQYVQVSKHALSCTRMTDKLIHKWQMEEQSGWSSHVQSSELSALVCLFRKLAFQNWRTLGSPGEIIKKLFSDKNNHEELPPKKRRNVGKLWPFWFLGVSTAAPGAGPPCRSRGVAPGAPGTAHSLNSWKTTHLPSRAVTSGSYRDSLWNSTEQNPVCVCKLLGHDFSVFFCFSLWGFENLYLYHTLYKRPALIIASHQHSTNLQSRLGYIDDCLRSKSDSCGTRTFCELW